MLESLRLVTELLIICGTLYLCMLTVQQINNITLNVILFPENWNWKPETCYAREYALYSESLCLLMPSVPVSRN